MDILNRRSTDQEQWSIYLTWSFGKQSQEYRFYGVPLAIINRKSTAEPNKFSFQVNCNHFMDHFLHQHTPDFP